MPRSYRDVLTSLGANIARAREQAGLTQAELAEAVGVEPRFVQAIEASTRAPSLRTLCALADALEEDVAALFHPRRRPRPNPGRPKRRGNKPG